MRSVAELLNSNAHYANDYQPATQADTDLLIVTCMDRRIDPVKIFDLQDGEAYVIRTAGGRTAEAIRSVSIAIAAGVRRIILMHHTDCKMAMPEAEIKRLLDENLDQPYEGELHVINDPHQALQEDVNRVSKLNDDLEVIGMIFEVETRRVRIENRS